MIRRTALSPHPIRNAACLIIGDEVLNGKIEDKNSPYFARKCFGAGLELRRVVVVPDEEEDIVKVLRDLKQYDFVVTTGGIGPTHDDITYGSIAAAFNMELNLHEETVKRMSQLGSMNFAEMPKDQAEARLRMATFPAGENVSVNYFQDLWVPLVGIENRVYIFPGIPSLFQRMLDGIWPSILLRLQSQGLQRRLVSTKLAESAIAASLTQIQNRYRHERIKIGSYPHMLSKCNTVSVVGISGSPGLESALKDVVEAVNGVEISEEDEAKFR